MASKLTREEKEKLFGKLQILRRNIENGTRTKNIFDAWQRFLKLTPREQCIIRDEWDAYYKAVQQTNIYQLFQKQRKALAEHDFKRVKELARESRQMREEGLIPELAKPQSIDPAEFEQGIVISAWKKLDKQIKDLSDYPDDAIDEEQQAWS